MPVKASTALMKPEPPASQVDAVGGIIVEVTTELPFNCGRTTMRSPAVGLFQSRYQPFLPEANGPCGSSAR